MRDCPFCHCQAEGRIVLEGGTVFGVEDQYPVTPGHHLIIPKRHVATYFDMTDVERQDADRLLFRLRADLSAEDSSINGFNIGMNCGASAGQTIFHAHIHLIPRRNGDADNPRGGVRGCVPGKMGY